MTDPFREARVCVCGDHGFVGLTRGFVAFVDAADVPLIADRLWCLAMRDRGLKYAVNSKPGDYQSMHRSIVPRHPGPVDHIDGDGLNNRRGNLRACSTRQNIRNKRPKKNAAVPFKGVFATSNGKFIARCKAVKLHNLGSYSTPEEAARAYDEAAIRLHGEFARTNVMLGLLPADDVNSQRRRSDRGR